MPEVDNCVLYHLLTPTLVYRRHGQGKAVNRVPGCQQLASPPGIAGALESNRHAPDDPDASHVTMLVWRCRWPKGVVRDEDVRQVAAYPGG